jgi:hypothetical protein
MFQRVCWFGKDPIYAYIVNVEFAFQKYNRDLGLKRWLEKLES